MLELSVFKGVRGFTALGNKQVCLESYPGLRFAGVTYSMSSPGNAFTHSPAFSLYTVCTQNKKEAEFSPGTPVARSQVLR